MKKEDFLEIWVTKPKIEDMNLKELGKYLEMSMELELSEIVPIPYLGGINALVKYKYPELIALCPMTGLPDVYTIEISFIPNKLVPELKSLKKYFIEFKDIPISHEHLHAKIFYDFQDVVDPKTLKVFLDVAIRGGVHTTINYFRDGKIT
jgi:7-cyano-7-deazaguanine reductase